MSYLEFGSGRLRRRLQSDEGVQGDRWGSVRSAQQWVDVDLGDLRHVVQQLPDPSGDRDDGRTVRDRPTAIAIQQQADPERVERLVYVLVGEGPQECGRVRQEFREHPASTQD